MIQKLGVVIVVVALLVGAGGVALSALTGEDSSSPAPMPTSAPDPGATEPPDPRLAEFYAQRLEWTSCRGSAMCARLTVPLDYARPDGATITLAVLGVPADDPAQRIGSLVVNPGGPGARGTDYAANAEQVFRTPLLEAYDVIGFDPRGTGGSRPVDCLSDEELDDYVALDPDPDTPEEVAEREAWTDRLGQGCVDLSGEVASHVTTVEAARDMDVLRAALGEAELDYFGASYGTKLGATYADLFPDKVGRLVLDGAVDLSISSRELTLEQAGGFETALRAYVEDCVGGDDCFLGDDADTGLDMIADLLDEIDADPLPAGDRELRAGNAFYGVVLPLYNRDYWPILTQALQAGLQGDGEPLLQLSDAYNSRGPGGYTDNSTEAFYAISCLDDPYAVAADRVPAQVADFEEVSPTFGRVFAWGLTTCDGIVARATEPARAVTGAGAPPIVVVGTTRDPATPYQWAVSLADQLESGVLVSRDGDGHTGYNSGNACVDAAIEDYLVDGTVPRDGLEC